MSTKKKKKRSLSVCDGSVEVKLQLVLVIVFKLITDDIQVTISQMCRFRTNIHTNSQQYVVCSHKISNRKILQNKKTSIKFLKKINKNNVFSLFNWQSVSLTSIIKQNV